MLSDYHYYCGSGLQATRAHGCGEMEPYAFGVGEAIASGRSTISYEINRDALRPQTHCLQGFLLRKGDDQIRTGEPAHSADLTGINRGPRDA